MNAEQKKVLLSKFNNAVYSRNYASYKVISEAMLNADQEVPKNLGEYVKMFNVGISFIREFQDFVLDCISNVNEKVPVSSKVLFAKLEEKVKKVKGEDFVIPIQFTTFYQAFMKETRAHNQRVDAIKATPKVKKHKVYVVETAPLENHFASLVKETLVDRVLQEYQNV